MLLKALVEAVNLVEDGGSKSVVIVCDCASALDICNGAVGQTPILAHQIGTTRSAL